MNRPRVLNCINLSMVIHNPRHFVISLMPEKLMILIHFSMFDVDVVNPRRWFDENVADSNASVVLGMVE